MQMKKKIKDCIAIALAVTVMASTMSVIHTKAEEVETVPEIKISSAAELRDYLGEAAVLDTSDENLVTLSADFELNQILTIDGGDITIDFNGHKLSIGLGMPYYVNCIGGTIHMNNDGGISSFDRAMVINGAKVYFDVNANPAGPAYDHDGYASITAVNDGIRMYSGTLETENVYISSSRGKAFYHSGGSIYSKNISTNGYDCGFYSAPTSDSSSVLIENGNFNGSTMNDSSAGFQVSKNGTTSSMAKYNIKNGRFFAKKYGITMSTGNVIIDGGTIGDGGYPRIVKDTGVYCTGGELSITGGAITGTKKAISATKGEVKIQGGTFVGKEEEGADLSDCNTTISGGTFTGTTGLKLGQMYSTPKVLIGQNAKFIGTSCGLEIVEPASFMSIGLVGGSFEKGIKLYSEKGSGLSLKNYIDYANGKELATGTDENKIRYGEDTIDAACTIDTTSCTFANDCEIVEAMSVLPQPTYQITYANMTDATNPETNVATLKTSDVLILANPTKEGYTFDGWYKEESFENKITSLNNVSQDTTIYAKWTPISTEPDPGKQKKKQDISMVTTYTKSIGENPFILDTSLVKGDGRITYVGGDKNIATVEYLTGKVSIHGKGTTTMIIYVAETEDYFEAKLTVTITINEKTTEKPSTSTTEKPGNTTQMQSGPMAKTSIRKATISGICTQYYTGKNLVQKKLKLVVNGRNLTLNKDYKVAYSSNKNIGNASITIQGIGLYTGTVKRNFAISIKKKAKYTVGKMKYQISNAKVNGTGTVTLAGATRKKNDKKFKKITVPATVKIGGKSFKVTAVGTKAFAGYKYPTKITIGKNVVKIGKKAFYGCKKVKKVSNKAKKLKAKAVGTKAFVKLGKKIKIKFK